jgi:hypothetical protein
MGVKWTSWTFLAFVGSLLFLVLYIKDAEIRGGVDRLSHMKAPQHSETSTEKRVLSNAPSFRRQKRRYVRIIT